MKSKLVSVLVLFASLFASAQAHFVWLERDASGSIAAYFGEWAAGVRETQEGHLKLISAPKASVGGKELPVAIKNDRIDVVAKDVHGDVRLTNLYFPEKGKSAVKYQAKLGRNETTARFDLELVPAAAGGNRFTLLFNGAPLPETDVTLFTSSGWNRTFKTDAAGKVTIETPWAGQAVIEAGHVENKAMEHDGRDYDSVRHVFALTFDVPASK